MHTTALAAVDAVGDVAKPAADTLIVYSGPTGGSDTRGSLYAENFRFFLRHGNHSGTSHIVGGRITHVRQRRDLRVVT